MAITQGVRENIQWVIEPGFELANRGLIILDRLTFLEPTRARSEFYWKNLYQSYRFESSACISC